MVKGRKRRNDRNHLVYRLTCDTTGETYIGITVCKGRAYWKSLATRWQKHLYHAIIEKRPYALQKAIRKHGSDAWSYEIIEIVRGKSAAHEIERGLIAEETPELNTECTSKKRYGRKASRKVG